MSNYLKINKSYIGNDILENPTFDMLSAERIKNSDFSKSFPSTETYIEGVMFDDWTPSLSGGGAYKLESIPNGYKQTIVTVPTSDWQIRISQNTSNFLKIGKVYKIKFTIKTNDNGGNMFVAATPVRSNGQYPLTKEQVFTLNSSNNFTVSFDETFKCVDNDSLQELRFYIGQSSLAVGNWLEVSNVSIVETGIEEYVPNPIFTRANTSDVPLPDTGIFPLWGYTAHTPPTSITVKGYKLEVVATQVNSGATFDLRKIPYGEELNLKIDAVVSTAGDAVGPRTIYINSYGDVDCSSGTVDIKFTRTVSDNFIYFRTGNNTSGTVTYSNISITPTNTFAFGWRRNLSATDNLSDDGNGIKFDRNNLSLTSNFSKIIGDVKGNNLSGNTELLVKYGVESFNDGVGFRLWTGSNWVYPNISIGDNEVRYTQTGDESGLFTGNSGSNGEITLNSIGLQEVKNQPKLIGISEVSTVSAPDNETIIISNRYTKGSDQVIITYEPKEGVSWIDVKNYFQDKIIQAANSNNTVKVFDINPPVLIKDIISS